MKRPAGPVSITRKVGFCASHRYHNPAWSDEKNRQVFGASNNPHGHGHNYELEVTVSGPIDLETGMVLNLQVIDRLVQEAIINPFDHRYINKEVPGFENTIPTTENIAIHIWDRLEPLLREKEVRLQRVRLLESSDLFVEYFGEGRVS